MDGRLVFEPSEVIVIGGGWWVARHNRGFSGAEEGVGWLVKGGGGREVAETVVGLDGGRVGGERALLPGELLAGLEGGVVEELRMLVLVTIGGVRPIIARGGGGGLEGR